MQRKEEEKKKTGAEEKEQRRREKEDKGKGKGKGKGKRTEDKRKTVGINDRNLICIPDEFRDDGIAWASEGGEGTSTCDKTLFGRCPQTDTALDDESSCDMFPDHESSCDMFPDLSNKSVEFSDDDRTYEPHVAANEYSEEETGKQCASKVKKPSIFKL